MSRSLEEWLRATLDAWNRRDRQAYLRVTPRDWELHSSGVFPGLKAVYRGPVGAGQLWDAMQGPWDAFSVTLERVEDLGDRIVGLGHFTVRGRDGIETEREWAWVIRGRDGDPTRTDSFATWAEAREAAGLRDRCRPLVDRGFESLPPPLQERTRRNFFSGARPA
jgi:ketosteroid isomerase-like protein